MIQVARLRGATVAGLDLAKFDEIESLGARPVDVSDLSAVSKVFDEGPPTVVIDLVGTASTARWGIDHLAMGGRLVMLATFPDRPVPIEARETVFRELSILGSRYSWKSQVAEAARLVADGSIKPIITEVRGPSAVPELHDLLRAGELVGRGALDWSLQ